MENLYRSWWSLPFDVRYYLWLVSGILFLLVFGFLAHRFIRAVLGHRRFKGAWYPPEHYRLLVQDILERQQLRQSVLDHDELKIVRREKGVSGVFGGRYGGYL